MKRKTLRPAYILCYEILFILSKPRGNNKEQVIYIQRKRWGIKPTSGNKLISAIIFKGSFINGFVHWNNIHYVEF